MYRCVRFSILLLFLAGCQYDSKTFRSPNLFQPGYLAEQQGWTQRFDPFASPDMGPKIVGDRPSGALDPTPASQRRAKQN
jgi:hypothetical protein